MTWAGRARCRSHPPLRGLVTGHRQHRHRVRIGAQEFRLAERSLDRSIHCDMLVGGFVAVADRAIPHQCSRHGVFQAGEFNGLIGEAGRDQDARCFDVPLCSFRDKAGRHACAGPRPFPCETPRHKSCACLRKRLQQVRPRDPGEARMVVALRDLRGAAVAGIEHDDLAAVAREISRRRQARRAAAYNDAVPIHRLVPLSQHKLARAGSGSASMRRADFLIISPPWKVTLMANKTAKPKNKQLRSQLWFDNPGKPRHDRALSRALPQLGPDQARADLRQADHRHRADRHDLSPCNRHHLELAERVRAGIRAAGGIAFEFPGASDPGNRQAPDRRARPQPRLSRPGRDPVRLSARRRRADDRLRQDHAGLHHGGGDREHPGDRAVRRADAQRLVEGRAPHRLRHGGVAGARGPRRRQDQLPGVHRPRRLLGAVDRPLQHDGHGLDHERARRGARHVAAGLRRDPGAVPRARADRL